MPPNAEDYDSDSDDETYDDYETDVTLGYASNDSTGDDFSQLGGHPTWPSNAAPPPGDFSKCKVCSKPMSSLLQLDAELPMEFPGHERKVYLFTCRQKACRRREGSVRGFRWTKVTPATATKASESTQITTESESVSSKPKADLGASLFGAKPASGSGSANPFAASGPASDGGSNPFAPKSATEPMPPSAASPAAATQASEPADPAADLPATFASKARIAAGPPPPPTPTTPWPSESDFPTPYPPSHIAAEKEYISPPSKSSDPSALPPGVRLLDAETEGQGSGSGNKADASAFESVSDKTFQKFSDRLAENPEQVLRYHFRGQPLLYSKTDGLGKTWPAAMKRCGSCGSERVFELQLVPGAIVELEREEEGFEGMDWGTVLLGVCGRDCAEGNEETWREEWVGVQWEVLGT
ncbi:hypothetical protein B0A48_06954 [Cryoendolithus antarcticus]|uniref:Programmed cell death protein 2 C-terminal domain-containing protein n=1 Tax=Cryoendolithus antarcticus TaxID=1507870 RepID=A0A1V8T9X8_9PEZI|nr:hypothetical protein B0A48_06954 [Cryoendolithus antarcticus]